MKCTKCGTDNAGAWLYPISRAVGVPNFEDVPKLTPIMSFWKCRNCGTSHFSDGTPWSKDEEDNRWNE